MYLISHIHGILENVGQMTVKSLNFVTVNCVGQPRVFICCCLLCMGFFPSQNDPYLVDPPLVFIACPLVSSVVNQLIIIMSLEQISRAIC